MRMVQNYTASDFRLRDNRILGRAAQLLEFLIPAFDQIMAQTSSILLVTETETYAEPLKTLARRGFGGTRWFSTEEGINAGK